MISQRGIEPNPDKIAAVQTMQSPKTHKEAQHPTGRIAALTRFISRVGDRSLPFFKDIKKGRNLSGLPCVRSHSKSRRHTCNSIWRSPSRPSKLFSSGRKKGFRGK
ncbi:hypothetical protein LIER_14094 [Lithospermum erythrorhizon]|uniref:Uncharacterized protein n=1 Tax=Lithospermum erythrorhizon TaxID=34254 RepID=A0AAV3Q209_LITER